MHFIVSTVARFVTDALSHGRGAIVVATQAHLDAVLAKAGDVRTAIRYHQLVTVDAEALLSRFIVDGMPNEGLFVENVVPMIVKVRAATGHTRVHIYGEMVDVLWRAGNTKAMLALEEMWTTLSSREGIESSAGIASTGSGQTEQRASLGRGGEARGSRPRRHRACSRRHAPRATVLLEHRAAALEAEI